MQTIDDFPEPCRRAIRAVSEELQTDYDTAYAMICLEAILWDLCPSDTVIVSMILDDVAGKQTEPDGKKHVGQSKH